MNQVGMWVGFNLFVIGMLVVDLLLFHRRAHTVRMWEAASWCGICVVAALVFAYGIQHYRNTDQALAFFTGYVVEMALSVDNIFVFVLIFAYFNVPPQYQHRALLWGILGALVMRGGMIAVGVTLVNLFDWVLYLFGAFLVYTGIKMAVQKEESLEPEANPILRLVRRMMPVSKSYHGEKFFVREARTPGGALRIVATPLFVVLVMIDVADLIFAVDSIPAVLGVIQKDALGNITDKDVPFLVYTSNVFAILCLRALYFLVANLVEKFRFLQVALAVILSFVGIKMLVVDFFHIPIGPSLGLIGAVLLLAIIASVLFPEKVEKSSPLSHTPHDVFGESEEPQNESEPAAKID